MVDEESYSGKLNCTAEGAVHANIRWCANFDPFATTNPSCFCVRFSPCDRYLAVAFYNGAICIFNTADGTMEYSLTATQNAAQSAVAMQLRWRPNSLLLMSGIANADLDGQIVHWSAQSGKYVSNLVERQNQVLCADYFQDGSKFATAGYDRKVRIYDDKTRQIIQTLHRGDGMTTVGHSNHINSLKCHPSAGHFLFSGGWDNTVQMWDTRMEKSFRSLSNVYICGDALDFDSSTDVLLTGSCRTTDALQLWDFNSGKLVETIQDQTDAFQTQSMLFTAQFSKDSGSRMIAAGGHQVNEAKFYSRGPQGAEIFGALQELDKPVFSLDFAHNSRMIAVGVADGGVRLLELKK